MLREADYGRGPGESARYSILEFVAVEVAKSIDVPIGVPWVLVCAVEDGFMALALLRAWCAVEFLVEALFERLGVMLGCWW